MTDTVNCIKCGAIIDLIAAQRILAMRQNDQELVVAHQWHCQDRQRCEARGPIAQTAEQLRADLEAAQTVIEALKGEVSRSRHDREVALELAQQSSDECEQLRADLEAAQTVIEAQHYIRHATILSSHCEGHPMDAPVTLPSYSELEEELLHAQQDIARLTAYFEDADLQRSALERQARARIVREIEFARIVRRRAEELQGDSNPTRRAVELMRRADAQLTAIEQDKAIEHPAEARVRELEAKLEQLRASEETVRLLAEVRRGRMIGDLDNWLTRLLADYQPDDDYALAMLLNDLSDALECLRSGSEWIR